MAAQRAHSSLSCLTASLFGLLALLLGLLPVQAAELDLRQAPDSPIGQWLSQWQEAEQALELPAARRLAQDGAFQPSQHSVPAFGIGARPVWLHLRLNNPASAPLTRHLQIGTTWIDHLDVYLLQDDRLLAQWQSGDADASLQHPTPGLGYEFSYDFPPGHSELFIRAATADPLALPVRILTTPGSTAQEHWQHYSYGFLYGFLFALLAYNAMLYAGLRQRSYLDYSIYLGVFILLNLAYSGHGYALLWPQSSGLQRFVIFWLMILFGCTGLRFAAHFLALQQHAPKVHRGVKAGCYAVLAAMLLCNVLQLQREAGLLAFSFALVFTLGMPVLGLLTVRHGQVAGRYFLLAVCCGMLGAAVTALSTWGVLPYSNLTHRAAELGLLAEASLLALALAYQMRQNQQARQRAESLARIDPLTGLLNRRAFLEQGEALWRSAERYQRPLAVIMLDLDHFKQINDSLGHAAGDQALVHTAQLLGQACRRSDLAARWGGEEFILLLPEANLAQAIALAERLREQIGEYQLGNAAQVLTLHASLGVADRSHQGSLEALIGEADHWLYAAKQGGRNRVVAPEQTAPA